MVSSLGVSVPRAESHLHHLKWEETSIPKLIFETGRSAVLKFCMLLDMEEIFQVNFVLDSVTGHRNM